MRYMTFAAMLLLVSLPAASASESSKLRSFERGSWQQLLHSHAGHPTLVHFWGVTCGPCKVELPQLGAFMKRNPSIDVVTIDADLVPDSNSAAQSMLQRAGLSSAENWMFSDGFAERLRYEVDPSWQGDIPRTILISRNGEIATIEGVAEPSVLQKWSDGQVMAAR
ncbi:MAG: TlpA family protein disulfide reductase [Bradyrhizobium sp.]|uniref:TlpA family protein disulfide reductase n=1 Tax=Bradyrhizobium sp. TaxID=376 RepID=UPI001C29C526|nr:TlpA disulfide reductase family protein [Bradyrhizobium sp.]MBU6461331.1 TlpA family protein disulfide reductase [Pseudomonadota bacterium]MDE2066506.1 TlpA family protein disulfide reductase [Bradyrhizobium sp.]MDE2241596.1 TlpA family protein disulfide reductase [Bradyrhizobium sp.]MDE2469157.1 TlpA family protein disulfide reductase [Bradyrhizobium sp.]